MPNYGGEISRSQLLQDVPMLVWDRFSHWDSVKIDDDVYQGIKREQDKSERAKEAWNYFQKNIAEFVGIDPAILQNKKLMIGVIAIYFNLSPKDFPREITESDSQ